MNNVGKALGTCGMWLGIGIALSVFQQADILSSLGAVFVMIGGFITTIYIWINNNLLAAIEKSLEEKKTK